MLINLLWLRNNIFFTRSSAPLYAILSISFVNMIATLVLTLEFMMYSRYTVAQYSERFLNNKPIYTLLK
jgi:hypothetical protein